MGKNHIFIVLTLILAFTFTLVIASEEANDPPK